MDPDSSRTVVSRMAPKVKHPPKPIPDTPWTTTMKLPIIAVEYKDRRVAIPRTSDYDEAILCVKNAFPDLVATPNSSLAITTKFPDFNMLPVEVGRRVWKEVLSEISVVKVLVLESDLEAALRTSKKRKSAPDVLGVPRPTGLPGARTPPIQVTSD